MVRIAASLVLAATLAGCQTTADVPAAPLGRAVLYFADGRPAGAAQLIAAGEGITVVASLSGLSPGSHAVHLHTTGKCEAPAFTSAGGHLNPAMHEHGMDNPKGMHLGDLPNAEAAANGGASLSAELKGSKETLLGEIYDADGTAIVVHEKADDYRTDPTGNAGSRLACGVFAAH